MGRTAIQLYTLRGIGEPLTDVPKEVRETSFDGIEFAHRVADADTGAIVESANRCSPGPKRSTRFVDSKGTTRAVSDPVTAAHGYRASEPRRSTRTIGRF